MYEDVFELLEDVRKYELRSGERIIPVSSVRGDYVGFVTADIEGPTTRWEIKVSDLRHCCEARTSDEARVVLSAMRSFHGRRQLVADLRLGTLVLEERPGWAPPLASAPEEPPTSEPSSEPDLEDEVSSALAMMFGG